MDKLAIHINRRLIYRGKQLKYAIKKANINLVRIIPIHLNFEIRILPTKNN